MDEYVGTPPDLPALWVALGHRNRAELAAISGDRELAAKLTREAYSEARSINKPYLQALLLLAWARVRAAGEDQSRVDELVDRAGALVTGKLNEASWWKWVLEALPVLVTGTGDLDRAETLVRTVPDPYDRARAVAELAVMVAARGEHSRAETLLGAVTDDFRYARLSDALAAISAVDLRSDVHLYRQARVLANLAETVAAGGSGHAWGASDWAEPLVRYSTDRNDQVLIFDALAAGAAGGERGRAAALAGRAEPIVALISDLADRPQALVSLAWMVADAGDSTRAADLADAAEALVRDAM